MTLPANRRTCVGVSMLAGMLVLTGVSMANSSEKSNAGQHGDWRLFDPEPLIAEEKVPPENAKKTTQLPEENFTRKLTAVSRMLVFNGVVSTVRSIVGENESPGGLWINGYPLDTASLPAGVNSVRWLAESQTLEVVLSSGSREYLSPGDSMELEN